MNRQEYNEFVIWANNVFEDQHEVLVHSVCERVDSDERVESAQKEAFKEWFRKMMPGSRSELPTNAQCVVKFRDSLLASPNETERLRGKLLHNGLHDLYLVEFEDEVELPSDYENNLKRRMIDALHETYAQQSQPESQPTVTEDGLAQKALELRKSKQK